VALPASAVLHRLEAGLARQQRGQVDRLGPLDGVAPDDGGVGQRVGQQLLRAIGRDHGLAKFGGWCRGLGQGGKGSAERDGQRGHARVGKRRRHVEPD
jgi:hypothetical protein